MLVADFMMFFGFLEFLVERSKEFPLPRDVVVGPLVGEWEDECDAILLLFFGGYTPSCSLGTRSTPRKNGLFDSTMGYPGEDVQLSF